MRVDMRKLGAMAKANRKKLRLTQFDISLKIGCCLNSITQVECGNSYSWKVISWYIVHDLITVDMIKGCVLNGKKAT